MKVLDLFSCVGCHALGMERAGHQTVQMCELNPWRRARLTQNFPGVPVDEDVTTLVVRERADVCFGGPPCQQTSVAAAIHGRRSGSSLWPWMCARGLEAGCSAFVVEQPPGNLAWEEEVYHDLSDAGFFYGRLEFGVSDLGGPYPRRRVFIVAFSSLPRLALAWSAIPSAIDRAKRAAASRGDWDADSVPSFGVDAWRAEPVDERRQRIEALGDSNPPAMAEAIGHIISAAYRDAA